MVATVWGFRDHALSKGCLSLRVKPRDLMEPQESASLLEAVPSMELGGGSGVFLSHHCGEHVSHGVWHGKNEGLKSAYPG